MLRIVPLISIISGLLLVSPVHARSSKSTLPTPIPFSSSVPSNKEPATKVHLNEADAKELLHVKGIGPKRAQAIVQYREKHGPFRSVDDLAQVRGIGTKKLEKLRPFLTV